MARPTIRDELLRNLEKASPQKQRELLAYARSLAESPLSLKGTPGEDLVVFAGAIETNDLAKIARAMEEYCEQVMSCNELRLGGKRWKSR